MPRTPIKPIEWAERAVVILDQTRLPQAESYVRCERVEQVAEAILSLRVRGAPLIGIAAAYGMALAAFGEPTSLAERVTAAGDVLRATRPTARNLFWVIDRMLARLEAGADADALATEALAIHREDEDMCRRIAEHGAGLIGQGATVLTICNTGSLATGGIGTALGIIRAAHSSGNPLEVLACETRPLLQGARLTMWELLHDGVPATLITDSMAATCMQRGMADIVISGADCIARNCDSANKIGTYSLAVLAKHHGIPFYVAAPMSSVDLALADGSEITIEERDAREVRGFRGEPVAPGNASVCNPAFDVTPADLIGGIVTERGVLTPPYEAALTAK